MTNDKKESEETKARKVEMKRREAQAWISKLSKEQMAEVEESFRIFDTDGSGSIDTSELSEAMKSLGVAPNEAELTRMIEEVDIDGDGNIDFDEFLGMMAQRMLKADGDEDEILYELDPAHHPRSSETLMQRAFKRFDVDGDGYINADDLMKLMQNMGEDDITMDEVKEMIEIADTDGDKLVNFTEFEKIIEKAEKANEQESKNHGYIERGVNNLR